MPIIWIDFQKVGRQKTEVLGCKKKSFNRKNASKKRKVRNFVLVNNLFNIFEIVNRKSKIVCQVALGSEAKSPQLRFWAQRGLAAKSPTAFSAVTPNKNTCRSNK